MTPVQIQARLRSIEAQRRPGGLGGAIARARAVESLFAEVAPSRAAQSQTSQGADAFGLGASAAGLLGSVGFSSELGAITINPLLAIPAALFLGLELAGVFSGKPKLQDTAEAAQRLMRSPFKPLQDLGNLLFVFAKNDVPLSTSNPKLQRQLRQAIQGTVRAILSAYPLVGSAGQVDTLLNRALTSQQGIVATAQLENLLARSAVLTQPERMVNAQITSYAQTRPQYGDMSEPGMPGLPQPPGWVPAGLPSGLESLVTRARTLLPQGAWAQLTLCLGLIALDQTSLADKCLQTLIVRVVEQGARDILQSIQTFVRNISGRRGRLPVPQPSPHPAPHLDRTQPCPECERGLSTKQREQLERERAELRTEIQTETGQQQQQSLDQIQQSLDHLKDLEQQPLEQRDIQGELRQKQQLQQQLNQLTQGGSGQPGQVVPTQPGEPAPRLAPEQGEAEQAEHAGAGVTFCVGCKSQEDAILFLNGEPSACSVVPGSTKEMHVNG